MASENLPALEAHLDAALSVGDLDRAMGLARRADAARPGGLDLDHALGITELMIARHHPSGPAATAKWHERFRAERKPREVEDTIVEAALRGLRDPVISGYCLRVVRLTIGVDFPP